VRENAIGICAPVAQAPVLAAAAADFVEENVQGFLVPLQPDAAFRPPPAALPVYAAEREKRTSPGTAGDDFRPYLAALRQVGYRGAIAIECNRANLAAEAAGSVRCLCKQWEETAC
jgi:uncharacterized protein YdbL (DUF1318 family)